MNSTTVMSMTSVPLPINENTTCWLKDNLTAEKYSIDFLYNSLEAHLGGCVATLLAVGGFTFNVLVIASVMYHKKTREQTLTPFIISLCASDLIFSVATLPFFAIRLFAGYVHNKKIFKDDCLSLIHI